MSEFEQLTFIKLLGISRSTSNKIPKKMGVLGELLRTKRKPTEIKSAIKRIKANFPKFKENKYFYFFEDYELRLSNSAPKSSGMGCVDEDKDKDKDLDLDEDEDKQQASPALQAAFTKISKDGLNIYALINKAKKLIGQPKEWRFPEEVLLRVCEVYEKDKANIEQPWPWFLKVLKAESALWHADQQIKANDKRVGFAPSVKEILGIK